MQLECPATVVTLTDGAVACVDGGGAAVSWLVTPAFDPAQIDALVGGGFFASGFVIVGTCWAIGKGARTVLSMIGR